LCAILTGCGDDGAPSVDRHPDAAASGNAARIVADSNAPAPDPANPVSADPLLAGSNNPASNQDPLSDPGDPLTKGADPLIGGAGSDPLLASNSGRSHAEATGGWFWLSGEVDGGAVGVEVNAVPVGRYWGHVDKEITSYCRRGANTLSITHFPTQTGGRCSVSLKIWWTPSNARGQAGAGETGPRPILTYDTSSTLSGSETPAVACAANLGSTSGPSGLGKTPRGATAESQGSATDTRSFVGE
jgi:hypothetical protein